MAKCGCSSTGNMPSRADRGRKTLRIHMKTTLTISDTTMRELKREAARRRQTMSELVEGALRIVIDPKKKPVALPPVPEFSRGGLRVNVADRDALYNVMVR